jgi:hypothetical protein
MHEWVFQRPQNCTSPKDECYLRPLKNSRVHDCLSKFHEKPCYYLFNNLHKNVRDNCSFNLRVYIANWQSFPLAKFFWLCYITLYNANSLKIPLNCVLVLLVLFNVKAFPFTKKKIKAIFCKQSYQFVTDFCTVITENCTTVYCLGLITELMYII